MVEALHTLLPTVLSMTHCVED
ncbi:unnamed protein product [Linum tenue]|uniref:Uncharacterized protein n=1 Tax=Linum tenue TaxID=586396 RepID=A0AAV0LFS7_9ROSI|nr:unnamed protein product [Linum tenue]CAI0432237.1 unnamed protein product [Linum tenue]